MKKQINLSVNKASKKAVEKIEAAGGKVTLLSVAK
ncbi:MAG: uL15 family ribosomal protein [Promethearchaeota archaeon]